jgi:hypothetical protein
MMSEAEGDMQETGFSSRTNIAEISDDEKLKC